MKYIGLMAQARNGKTYCYKGFLSQDKIELEKEPFLVVDHLPRKETIKYPVKDTFFSLSGFTWKENWGKPGNVSTVEVDGISYSGTVCLTPEYFDEFDKVKKYLFVTECLGKYVVGKSVHKSWLTDDEQNEIIKFGSFTRGEFRMIVSVNTDIITMVRKEKNVTLAEIYDKCKSPTMWPEAGCVWNGPEPDWSPPVHHGQCFTFQFRRDNENYTARAYCFADPGSISIFDTNAHHFFTKKVYITSVYQETDEQPDFFCMPDASFVRSK